MTKLGPAIFAVMEEAGTIAKRGTNTFHKYDYATAADVLYRLQGLFAKHKINVIKTERHFRLVDDGNVLAVTYRFMLVHESGEAFTTFLDGTPLEFTGLASARNSKGGFDDKAANKCSTAAMKYFLIDFFKIPTGDYADPDSQEDQAAPKRKAPPPEVRQDAPPLEARPPEVIPADGRKMIEWTVDFLGAVNAATASTEIDEWLALNSESVKAITEKGGALAKRFEDAVNAAYVKLGSTIH